MKTLNLSVLFATASLLPAACLLAGGVLGGAWAWSGLLVMTVAVWGLDRTALPASAGPLLERGLPLVLATAHFAVLAGTVTAVALPGHLTDSQTGALLLGTGLWLGQVSNACAHELIHRQDRVSRLIGAAVFSSMLNGHHVSAHLLVHHVWAGTGRDPNTAAAGESFYRFMQRAPLQEFRAGWKAESRRQKQGRIHPYTLWIGGALLSTTAAAFAGGLPGLAAFAALSFYAHMQLMLSDYVQHYGLVRETSPDGKARPVSNAHSWNAPQNWSGAMMLNAPRHSDHHSHPGRSFSELRYEPVAMPTLPFSLPVMGAIAFLPPLWRRVMDPRVARWTATGPVPSEPVVPAVAAVSPL
ncbi:alkane 1-monooxygenase [uncultured Roseobacter sp.]|uniref:alkane 1-monooxygenase n=1 Tax=uncultured Roseobacter sp. TaxID=114847 RepID=UPI002631B2D1|nr:alkane 1-monooxygenase [uncultured Roseobacter sp.]